MQETPQESIKVTSPLLPDLEYFNRIVEDIWKRKYLTNNAYYHNLLEEKLCEYLDVPYISLFNNGTIALICALQALDIQGEVITTAYTFAATAHAIWWNRCTPVFVDIEPESLTIDPRKIEAAISERTTAIMPVHVYGTPCNIGAIEEIAQKFNLKVIYDAAHAFGVTKGGESILRAGNLSILSFHATKLFSTIEGGAIISHTAEMKHHIDNLKNFGFRGETVIEEPGINGKLNELQAAFGLAALPKVKSAVAARKQAAAFYREQLSGLRGLSMLPEFPDVESNSAYFPIFISPEFGISRDCLYEKLKSANIYGRRYFYPLISEFEPYSQLPSANPENLPNAVKAASEVICLPMHHELTVETLRYVTDIIISQGVM